MPQDEKTIHALRVFDTAVGDAIAKLDAADPRLTPVIDTLAVARQATARVVWEIAVSTDPGNTSRARLSA
jgi:hypothetical protein